MKTAEIIEEVKNFLFEKEYFKQNLKFETFNEDFEKEKENINIFLKEKFGIDGVNFKNDAIFKIMNSLYLKQVININNEVKEEWNRDYVRGKYLKKIKDIEFIYYPSTNPKKIIFTFSAMRKDKFDRYDKYWDKTEKWEQDTIYIFFKDDDFTYFIGNKKIDAIKYIIKNICLNFNIDFKNVYSVGSSMGGYAAIFYGLLFNFKGVLVANPQINARSVVAHKFDNWSRIINTIQENWVDVDLFSLRFEEVPFVYIEYSSYNVDILGVECFLEQFKKQNNFTLIMKKNSSKEHSFPDILSVKNINNVITFFDNN